MAVLMTAQLPGATQEMIDGMRPLLDPIRHAKGFVVHANGPVPGGWRPRYRRPRSTCPGWTTRSPPPTSSSPVPVHPAT